MRAVPEEKERVAAPAPLGRGPQMPPGRPKAAAKSKPQTFTKLQFECEKTGGLVAYEVPSDAGTVKDFWRRRLMLNCSHCGEVHDFAFRSAFIRGVLSTRDASLL